MSHSILIVLFTSSLFIVSSCSKKAATIPTAETSALEEKQSDQTTSSLPDQVTFNAHIRPIFSDTCFACHGFDSKTREADLRLDTPEGAYAKLKDTKTDEHSIVPGDPQKSAVWQRLITTDTEKLMPPEEFHKPINVYQKALIRRWIEQGAKYEQHWAYQPIKKPSIPTLSESAKKTANPIDAFILKQLENKNIKPTEPTDKRTLLRRLSLDLTGVPPTPAEIDFFLNDTSANAYENQVDRLLTSPRYGERMAVTWLDVARYADTVGFHGDQNQHIFPYRDYVINAFNNNKPFDQFTIEQLAGDLLENPTDEQYVATGFIRLSQMTREGGAQPKEYLAKYASDRVRSIGAAWLGQTTGCAECHDHKFDPITAKDFYSLSAFFKDIKQWGVYTNYKYSPNPDLAGFDNDYPFPPEIIIKSPSMLQRLKSIRTQAHQQNAARAKTTPAWEKETQDYLKEHPTGWAPATPLAVSSSSNTPTRILTDGRALLTGPPSKADTITLNITPQPGRMTAFRVELLPSEKNKGFVGRGENGNFAVGHPQFTLTSQNSPKPTPLAISWAQADYFLPEKYQSGYAPLPLAKIWRPGNLPWSLANNFQQRKHTAIFILKTPITVGKEDRIRLTLKSDDIGCIRISTTRFGEPVVGQPAVAPELLQALSTSPGSRTPAQQTRINGTWALAHLPTPQLAPNWPILQKTIRQSRGGISKSLIALTTPKKEIPVTRILPRGDWQNESGEVVQPNVLHFLPQPKDAGKRTLTRLDLAKWLVADNNPLTARHVMNRYWKQFFGNGLSNVLDDLGSQGEWPSHPELLDWLAHTFRSSGWDTKHMIKLIVTSNSYQQKSGTRKDLKDIDPYNRLLAQQSPRRLDAEFIRDNALAISGLLKIDYTGGPSVFPYQPPGYYGPIQFPDRKYIPDQNSEQYRRGVYMHWQRTFLHPMLANFDAPSREECSADRLQSNSPLQALTLLNDPASVEMARAFALRLISQAPTTTARIDIAYTRTLSRPPREDESQSLQIFVDNQIKHYRSQPQDAAALVSGVTLPKDSNAAELAGWTQACRVLLNLHETITRY